MTEPTEEQLAQDIADFFAPPFRAEEWEYIDDGRGKPLLRDTGFRDVRFLPREGFDQFNSPARTTVKTWVGGEQVIQERPLTFLEIAEAVLVNYRIEKRT